MKTLLRLLTFLSVLNPAVWAQSDPVTTQITIIVHQDNPVQSIAANELADLFLKRKRQWPDRSPVRFIDRRPGTEVRNIFLKSIVNKSTQQVDLHWIRQIASGDSAPMQVPDDETTIELVASFKDAVGYINGPVTEGRGVKKLEVTGTR